MKKILIGLATAASLVATPAFAVGPDSAWDVVDSTSTTAKQLVLIGGLADELDTCGNGKPYYTLFLPSDDVLNAFLDDLGVTVADLSATPAVVTALLNDHIAKGSYAYAELQNTSVTRIVMRSGFVASKSIIDGNVYIENNLIVNSQQVCNGHVHWISGVIDSTAQVPTVGVDTPAPATAPVTASASTQSLPNTL